MRKELLLVRRTIRHIKMLYVDERLYNYSKDNLDYILVTSKITGIEDYFWFRMRDIKNPEQWFMPMYEYGMFNAKNNPYTNTNISDENGIHRWKPWNVLGFLENVAKNNVISNNCEVNTYLKRIVKDIIDTRVLNDPNTTYYVIHILSYFKDRDIKKYHLVYLFDVFQDKKFDRSLEQMEFCKLILPKLIKSGLKTLLVYSIDRMLDFEIIDTNQFDRYQPYFKEHWIDEAFHQKLKDIVDLCGDSIVKICIRKIRTIVKNKKQEFMYFGELINAGFNDYKYKIIEYTCDTISYMDGRSLYPLMKNWINERTIFSRLCIYAINKHYTKLKQILWLTQKNLINHDVVRGELYTLFVNNSKLFSSKEVDTAIQWIETANYHIPPRKELKSGEKEEIFAYRKRQWLKSLLPSEDKKVKELYVKYGLLNDKEPEAPFFGMRFGGFTYGSVSPISESFFNESSMDEIIKKIKEYPGDKNIRDFELSSIKEVLKNSISKNPAKYLCDWKNVISINNEYQDAFITGLNVAWNNKIPIDWGAVLEYLIELFNVNRIGSDPININDTKNSYLLCKIADFVVDGVKNDENAFDNKYLKDMIDLVIYLDKELNSTMDADKPIQNFVVASLNSSKSRIITALMHLSLHCARQKEYLQKEFQFEYSNNWIKIIHDYCTDILNGKEKRTTDHTVVFAEFLPNLHYLDKQWVENNINTLFDERDTNRWKAAFESYLEYYSTVYQEIYKLLKEKGLYNKAIYVNLENENAIKALAQHICVGYYWDWDTFEDKNSLISTLISKGSVGHIKEIVEFFRRSEKNLKQEYLYKIKPLWNAVIKRLNEMKDDKKGEIYANLVSWGDIIEKIDEEIYENMRLSLPYLKKYYHFADFVDTLNKNVTKSPDYVAKLLYEATQNGIFIEYVTDEMKALVENLYKYNLNNYTNQICNIYGENGRYDFKDIYFKYNTTAS